MRLIKKWQSRANNKKLLQKDFSIISDNCWGNFMYNEVDVKYNSPFVGLFIYADDYIKLLNNLKYYLKCELKEIKTSKWEDRMPNKKIIGTYPIGVLADTIEIHFMHYKDWDDVLTKWNRRVNRINYDNLYVKMSERALCDEKHIEAFDQLPYPNKVCFTKQEYSDFKSCVYLEKCKEQPFVQDEWLLQKKKFSIVSWLNTGNYL